MNENNAKYPNLKFKSIYITYDNMISTDKQNIAKFHRKCDFSFNFVKANVADCGFC